MPKASTNVGHNKVALTKPQIEILHSKLPDDAYLWVVTEKNLLVIDVKRRYATPTKEEEMFETPIIHWKNPNLYLGALVSRKLCPDGKLSKSGKIQLIIANGDEVLSGEAKDRPPKIAAGFMKLLEP